MLLPWLLVTGCPPPAEVPLDSRPESLVDSPTDSPQDSQPQPFEVEWEVLLEDFVVLRGNLPAQVEDCLALAEAPCADLDQDGLVDAWEDEVLRTYHPTRVLDEAEPAFNDDSTLVDVGRVAPLADGVGVFIMLGWSVDYGRCGVSGHNGDSERVALKLHVEGDRAVVDAVYTAAHEGTALDHGRVVTDLSTLSVSAEPRWRVFVSEGKHATYSSVDICENVSFVPCVDEDCAPDGVNQALDYERLPEVHNAGEEEHPRLTALDGVGFPGDDAWADQPFCGGLDRGGSCSSAVREKLLVDPF